MDFASFKGRSGGAGGAGEPVFIADDKFAVRSD